MQPARASAYQRQARQQGTQMTSEKKRVEDSHGLRVVSCRPSSAYYGLVIPVVVGETVDYTTGNSLLSACDSESSSALCKFYAIRDPLSRPACVRRRAPQKSFQLVPAGGAFQH